MKKAVFIIIINLIFITAVIAGINFYWERNYQNYPNTITNTGKINIDINLSEYDTEMQPSDLRIQNTNEVIAKFCLEKRQNFGTEYILPPITVLGCSYAYGHGLTKEESFPYLLSNITKRPVLNYAICGSNLLEQLDKIYNDLNMKNHDIVKESQYVIYVYMHDHITRYFEPTRYDLNVYFNDLFKLNKIEKILSRVFLFKYIIARLKMQDILSEYPNSERSQLLLKKVIEISAERIKKLAPHAKFIVVLYEEKISTQYPKDYIKFHIDTMYSNIWDELEKEGIIIVHTKDLLGFKFDRKYKLEHDFADWHPNEKAWEVFTPEFAKKYIKP